MRVLILGNNYVQKTLCNYLKKNNGNIVFSTNENYNNKVDFSNYNDVLDFCEANEINFVLPTEKKYISDKIADGFNRCNVTYFAPNEEADEICKYKSCARKFSYKNKIPAPKFFIAEKSQSAMDYIKTSLYPIAIHPDEKSYTDCVKFAQTYTQAQKYINNFFENGCKKVVIENYIEGKNIIFWAISDGYNVKIIANCAKYQDNVSYFNPEFISEKDIEHALRTIIEPAILNLSLEGTEYIGIIGFDTILTREGDFYLTGYKDFFDDLNIDFFVNGFELNWFDVFESCLKGDVFLKYDFRQTQKYMLTLRQDEKIEFISANSRINLKRYLNELGFDTEEYDEAEKIWKY